MFKEEVDKRMVPMLNFKMIVSVCVWNKIEHFKQNGACFHTIITWLQRQLDVNSHGYDPFGILSINNNVVHIFKFLIFGNVCTPKQILK